MLRLSGGQVESLWDEVLPVGVRALPEDLAALDVLLGGLVRVDRGGLAAGGSRARAPDDLDADVCAFDGDNAAHGLGTRR
jgi:hypothetical protein